MHNGSTQCLLKCVYAYQSIDQNFPDWWFEYPLDNRSHYEKKEKKNWFRIWIYTHTHTDIHKNEPNEKTNEKNNFKKIIVRCKSIVTDGTEWIPFIPNKSSMYSLSFSSFVECFIIQDDFAQFNNGTWNKMLINNQEQSRLLANYDSRIPNTEWMLWEIFYVQWNIVWLGCIDSVSIGTRYMHHMIGDNANKDLLNKLIQRILMFSKW